jgi:hypothetical protein
MTEQDCLDDEPDARNLFWESISQAGARLYLCGHAHCYSRTRLDDGDGNPNNDVQQVILNSCDKVYGLLEMTTAGDKGHWRQLLSDHEQTSGTYGYLLVQVDDRNVQCSWKRRVAAGLFEATDIFSYSLDDHAPCVAFADANLKAAVESALGKSDPNTDDMADLLALDVHSSDIHSLDGLQYAPNLSELYVADNEIHDLYPLADLKNLTVLDLVSDPLDRAAYCLYLPQIAANNPTIAISCDPNPLPGGDCIVEFADPNLQAAVEAALTTTSPTFTDLLALRQLKVVNKGLADLSGLEHAKNLTWLRLTMNNHSLDYSAVLGLDYISWLALQGCEVEDASELSQLPNLAWLELTNNHVSDISTLASLQLPRLKLGANPLNTAAYCTHLPAILQANPSIDLTFDPDSHPFASDCSTGLMDLGIFVSQWLETGCTETNTWCAGADLDHKGDVALEDFAEFGTYWITD